ncbi:tagatose 6-phosphate kinase [Neobacillus niacini]|uniref:1-phosphofructokinase n=1 Tax=Neobacillus niacini TaxID=86668 RepID=UPI00285DEE6E|nr:1-phosphofructokinase [Neobacillus niacini]MDR7079477.1 tagatose 6-phosphate kinase [Neobacillus niacini]
MSPKILVVTLNPSIDTQYFMDSPLKPGVQRVTRVERTAGGKGLNVARVLKKLGNDVVCTGFSGGYNGQWIQDSLMNHGIQQHFVEVQGDTRICLSFSGPEEFQPFEVLEAGPEISAEEQEKLKEVVEALGDGMTAGVISGSLPRGVPHTYYQELIQIFNKKNVPVYLDTSGEVLNQSLKAKPLFVKPNLEELELFSGTAIDSEEDIIDAAKDMMEKGAANVLVSLGAKGALLVSDKEVWKANVTPLKKAYPVGSGDSLLAGVTYALSNGKSWPEALRYGCACGVSNAINPQTGNVELEQVETLLNEIQIERVRKEVTNSECSRV